MAGLRRLLLAALPVAASLAVIEALLPGSSTPVSRGIFLGLVLGAACYYGGDDVAARGRKAVCVAISGYGKN